jgi:hypothetical protein
MWDQTGGMEDKHTQKKLLIGGGIAVGLLAIVCLGLLVLGMAFGGGGMMRNRFNSGYYYEDFGPRQAPRAMPAQPRDDGRFDTDPRRDDYRGYERGFRDGARRGGMGWGPFAFIGGILRFMLTLGLLALAFVVLRRLLGGGRRWGAGAPPWAEEWHRKMHERMDGTAKAAAPAQPTPVDVTPASPSDPTGSPGSESAKRSTSEDESGAHKPDDSPVI